MTIGSSIKSLFSLRCVRCVCRVLFVSSVLTQCGTVYVWCVVYGVCVRGYGDCMVDTLCLVCVSCVIRVVCVYVVCSRVNDAHVHHTYGV